MKRGQRRAQSLIEKIEFDSRFELSSPLGVEEQLSLIRDLEVARIQGQRWRTEARSLIDGLGEAIEAQFNLWNLSEAEREVALLLLKGLSLKEIVGIR